MRHLQRLNKDGAISIENIFESDFSERFPHIDVEQANLILHGELPNGEVITGLDVTYHAWSMVGKKAWVSFLRWPILRHIFDGVYWFFAKYRHPISFLLTGQKRCDVCK